jgi:hypothetical protein
MKNLFSGYPDDDEVNYFQPEPAGELPGKFSPDPADENGKH